MVVVGFQFSSVSLHVDLEVRVRVRDTKMVARWILLMVVVSSILSHVECDGKIKKLQIGVKKRIENCTRKSKNGDSLEMHYTVSHTQLFAVVMLLCMVLCTVLNYKTLCFFHYHSRVHYMKTVRNSTVVFPGTSPSFSLLVPDK